MNKNLPTYGQLERNLAQSIQKLYRQELEHNPSKVTCQLFGNQIVIVIEDALPAVEKILIDNNQLATVERLNSAINNIIKFKIKILIEEVLMVRVENILLGSTIETNRSFAIAILDSPPLVRHSRQKQLQENAC